MRPARLLAKVSLVLAVWCPAVGAVVSAAEYSYSDLIRLMLDPSHVAVLPDDGESCRQWSSWDRNSRYDSETDTYVNWAANGDGHHFIREENGMQVLAEMQGPGCIWRIWSALAQAGHVKIYIDGAETPAVDLPFEQYFDGKTAPFAYPHLSYNLAEDGCRGQNLYFPIPYQKSCKIVAEPNWGRYYQFVYRTFPEGTKVPSFSTELAAAHADKLAEVDRFFAERMGELPPVYDDVRTVADSFTLPAGETRTFAIEGPAAIVGIRGKLEMGDREDEMAALRQVTLSITWDDQSAPAVWCPVGDFFGTAPGKNLYRSFLTGVTENGGYAYWYMPFGKSAEITLTNEGDTSRNISCELLLAPLRRPMRELGYFHCKWHRDTFPVPADRWPDWSLLRTTGRGRFVGVMLHVWNPAGGWWGEGDEKFFVDNEKYPSTFGTGSEDYFGYAWCDPHLFQKAYHAQTMTENNHGHQSVLRWQLVDNIPFHTAFDGYIEKYFRTEEKGTQYAVTVCWYLNAEGNDPYRPVPVESRHGYYVKTPPQAGGFKILNEPNGNVGTQGMAGFPLGKWTNNDQLWWTGAHPGDVLELSLPVEADGTYRVAVVLTKARDYGIVRFAVDGTPIGEPIDLYNPQVVRTEPITLGSLELTKGDHVLSVTIVGANPKAIKAYMFGLDEVRLEPKE
ncbi:MAG: DUF2961 domain-containing protein [Planctomycetota bacterium]|nr:MAG: DUF2961 domain-containing protein [Planctomycetota bacterium]